MEEGYTQGKSDNLPIIDPFMISAFFIENTDYLSAEIKGVKSVRATRDTYGDKAVGYVQLKRDNNICVVKGKITPEHKIRGHTYNVTLKVDEGAEKIISSECHDCVASRGGCKHAIAFLYWVLRRSEEPSPTSVECYWRKSLLSKVGTTIKVLKAADLKHGEQVPQISEVHGFLNKVITQAREEKCEGNLVKYFTSEDSVKKLSVHYLGLNYFANTTDPSVNNFIEYCKSEMSSELCKTVATVTCDQYKCSLWYELRYGRITASKIHEASTCSSIEGSLYEQILGAATMFETEAIKRGRELEEKLIQVVSKKRKIKVTKTGLILDKRYPMLGASPDGIAAEYVLEVKCPFSEKTIKNYFGEGNIINKKYMSQIQLQMLFCNRQKGLFCVAAPDFEVTNDVTIIEVDFDKSFIENVIFNAMKFWEKAIFPGLVK